MEDPVVPLERNLYGHLRAGLSWERQFENILLKHGWEKIPNWECLFVHREKGLFLSVYVDDLKLAGKKQNLNPMWKVQHHSLIMYTSSRDIVDNYRTKFESRISAGATEKLPCSENLCITSWSYDMEGHAKKCVERQCELANKTIQQLYKVSTPCIGDHHFKEEELQSVGELSKVCSQIVLKCLYLARIGRPGTLWSVNKLARSITKWTKAFKTRGRPERTSGVKRYYPRMNGGVHAQCCAAWNNADQQNRLERKLVQTKQPRSGDACFGTSQLEARKGTPADVSETNCNVTTFNLLPTHQKRMDPTNLRNQRYAERARLHRNTTVLGDR